MPAPVLDALHEVLDARSDEAGDAGRFREDADRIGLLGLVVGLIDPPPEPDDAIREDFATSLARRLATGEPEDADAEEKVDENGGDERVETDDEPPADVDPTQIPDLVEAYEAEHGPALRHRLVRNHVYEYFGLREHGLFADDVDKVLRVLEMHRDGGARPFARSLVHLSRLSAKQVLGHFPDQIDRILMLSNRTGTVEEASEVLEDFAPSIIARRFFALCRKIVPEEVRLRLALILWGWFRGLRVGKDDLLEAADRLEDRPADVVDPLLDRADAIHALAGREADLADDLDRIHRAIRAP